MSLQLARLRRRRILVAAGSGALVTVLCAVGAGLVLNGAEAATQICDQYGSTAVSRGAYIVQNNDWGDTTTQCISVTDDGFGITTASHAKPANGAPGAYPSIYAGPGRGQLGRLGGQHRLERRVLRPDGGGLVDQFPGAHFL